MQYKFEQPVHGSIGALKYQCTIEWRNGKIIADEPATNGGGDTGADPYTLLLSSLASCTLITLRMYIDRKGWDIPEIAVNVNMFQEQAGEQTVTYIDRDIVFLSPATDVQKMRLKEIATNCPISKILEGDIKVRTFIFRDVEEAKTVKYANEEVTVLWKPELCQHSKRCWTELPQVFDYKEKKWINPSGASAEELANQIKRCPSGALTFLNNK